MKSEPTNSTLTADGFRVYPLDAIWHKDRSGWVQRTVAVCYEKKVEFSCSTEEGYIGAKSTLIFFEKPLQG